MIPAVTANVAEPQLFTRCLIDRGRECLIVGAYCRLLCPLALAIASTCWATGQDRLADASKIGRPALGSNHQLAESNELEADLNRLIETTQRVREQIESTTPKNRAAEPSGIRAMLEDKQPEQVDASRSASEIRERIRLLRKLRERSAHESPSNAGYQNQRTFAHIDVSDRATNTVSAQKGPTLAAIERNLNESAGTLDRPEDDIAPTIQATKILSNPVSHLQLGQSLYQTKNYSAALKALDGVNVDTLSESDRSWLELLIALCHRRLGNVDSAEAQLRELANTKSTDYPIPVARWWLKHTKSIRDSKIILDNNSIELDTLIERSKEHVKY